MHTEKILISIFHKDGKDNENFNRLKAFFKNFDIYIPHVEYYGNKWTATKDFFINNNYNTLFVICSDVSIVCGDISSKIKEYSNNQFLGTFGFGTINNSTFPWLKYDSTQLIKDVPFIEGYCFGVNEKLLAYLELENQYGYGIDVEMGYKAHLNGLRCILSNEVCISHAFGKSYDNTLAINEYRKFLIEEPQIQQFLNNLSIPHPLL